jgi:hypothetical protein
MDNCRENDGCRRMTTHGRWTMDNGRENDGCRRMTTHGRWTMDARQWAERTFTYTS